MKTTTVVITGCTPMLLRIDLMLLIRDYTGVSLAEAKRLMEEVIEPRRVALSFDDCEIAESFLEKAILVGAFGHIEEENPVVAKTRVHGSEWRILADQGDSKIEMHNQGIFDELVIDQWCHLEQMDHDLWWLKLGDARIMVTLSPDGEPSVNVQRGFYSKIKGITTIASEGSGGEGSAKA